MKKDVAGGSGRRKTKEERFERARRVGKAFTHRIRLEILEVFTDQKMLRSPSELAAELEEPVGKTSYHVNELLAIGAIELRDTESRRGALEHYYGLTQVGHAMRSLLRRL